MQILKLSHLFATLPALVFYIVFWLHSIYNTDCCRSRIPRPGFDTIFFFLHLPSVGKLIDTLIGFSNHAVQPDTRIYTNERFCRLSNAESEEIA